MGHPAYLDVKTEGDRSMPGKREMPEGAEGHVSQDPRDMVKARLLEPQSPVMETYIPRSQRLWRGHRHTMVSFSPSESSGRWAVANDATQGDGWGTYVALDTSSTVGTRDRLRGASPRATEPP